MMKASTVNISFSKELLDQVDETARKECRSRSELLPGSGQDIYRHRRKRWDVIFELAGGAAKEAGMTEGDIDREVTPLPAGISRSDAPDRRRHQCHGNRRFSFGGNPRDVLLQVIRGEIGLGMSPAMLYELQGVLSRKKFGLAEQFVETVMNEVKGLSDMVFSP
jgi:predicted transcriptional regulator